MAFARSIATVGGFTLASRALGFVRDVMVASYLGAGPAADAFFVAFKFPNFFRRLFAEGAFNAAFLPMFAGRLATLGASGARAFAEDALAVLLTTLLVFLIVAEATMGWLMMALAPGFLDEPEKYRLAVHFARITFPYLLFISLVSLFGGVLNSLDRFAAVAATPIFLNLALIAALLGFTQVLPGAGHALAWGVAAAGIVQFAWLAGAAQVAGMGLRLKWPRLTPEIRRLATLMLPAAFGSGVVQVNLMIDVVLASLLPTGAVSYLYYADRLYELPLAVIGIAIGTAILPRLAREVRATDQAGAVATLNRGLEAALLLTLPAAAALIVLAQPIVAVLFERGAFGPESVRLTATAVAAYGLGLPGFVLIKVLVPGFYAREDTRTPVKIAVVCVIVNTLAAAALMYALHVFLALGHVGIALATGLSGALNALLLASSLMRHGHLAPDAQLRRRVGRMALAALVMAAALVAARQGLAPWLAGNLVWRVSALALLVAGGAAVYGACAQALGAADWRDLKHLLGRPPPPSAPPASN